MLLPAWTILKSIISHPVIPVLAEYCHFAIMPQIATYFAGIMPAACRYQLYYAGRLSRLKPTNRTEVWLYGHNPKSCHLASLIRS